MLEGICSYERTNKYVCVVVHVGVLLCCGGVRGYTNTHNPFDLGDLGCVSCCNVHDEACMNIHKERFVLAENQHTRFI